MNPVIIFIGWVIFMLAGTLPSHAEEALLWETWLESRFHPERADAFMQKHAAEYTDAYFQCSQEAQRTVLQESKIRDRQCDFSSDSEARGRCRKHNQFRGIDKHLAELDQTIRVHTPWRETESGRNAVAAKRASEEFDKSCSSVACQAAKRQHDELLRDLKPHLMCR